MKEDVDATEVGGGLDEDALDEITTTPSLPFPSV